MKKTEEKKEDYKNEDNDSEEFFNFVDYLRILFALLCKM